MTKYTSVGTSVLKGRGLKATPPRIKVLARNRGTHHDHLVCLGCGRVAECYDAEIEARQREVARAIGFGAGALARTLPPLLRLQRRRASLSGGA